MRLPVLPLAGAMLVTGLAGSAGAAVPAAAPASVVSGVGSTPSPGSASLGGADQVKLPGGGVIALPKPPQHPALYSIEASAYAATVHWSDDSTNEGTFVVYRRDLHGAWQAVHTTPTHDMAGGGGLYSWVDTDRSLSAQCYKVAAVSDAGGGYTGEACTVRPDPSRFPQQPPAATLDWYGLSRGNDVAAPLFNVGSNQYLRREGRTFGVSLGWGADGNNVKLERQGDGSAPLMKGETVALRIWGAGWLKHGTQSFGVDLELADTPSYEWVVVGGTPGQPLDDGRFALWSASAQDFLVHGDQTWSIGLNWYQQTLPPPQTQPVPPLHGVKTFVAYNCTTQERPLEMWVADYTAGTGFVDKGRLDSQTVQGGCPQTGQPWTYSPPSGHQILVEAVDFAAPDCANDPQLGSCQRSSSAFTGDANGQVVSSTIS
jgi:hypothetical protein